MSSEKRMRSNKKEKVESESWEKEFLGKIKSDI